MTSEHCGMATLGMSPNCVTLRSVCIRERLGQANNVECSACFTFADDVGVATWSAKTFKVGCDNEVAGSE